MFVNDVLSDMIARINNAQMASLGVAELINSKLSQNVLTILKDEGFIEDFAENEDDNRKVNVILKYNLGKGIISSFARVSKPGRRVYSKIADLPRYYNGLGIAILSTPKGVIPDYKARDLNVGGEILCVIF
ncbi:MAG: 30S ribosomal protein S8 [Alphaproteobacteria bacterium]|jgi:small subunit ribosomal protein S8|nr:30S ribosomal protein S8 [Alphaproteobacteria bacterium]